MKNKLQEYFPVIKTREEVYSIIKATPRLNRMFLRWKEEQQEEFLDFCSGARGIKVLYDSFFKEVFDPQSSPERLSDLLSVLLGIKVKILKALPLNTSRMGDESSLVQLDLVVETQDGTVINVEVQKLGYLFPGQRSACYSADLLLRQYKRTRDSYKHQSTKFSYKKVMPVYTIVFFEKSPDYFHEFPNTYIHNFKQSSDTGLNVELLQRYKFICLDIFKKVRHNVNNKIDAWLTFLSSDEPQDIISLIDSYPEFKPLYDTLYNMCKNMEDVMNMFSEELRILDKNTELLMIDEFSKTIESQKKELVELENTITKHRNTISEQENTISEQENTISEQENTISEQENTISKLIKLCKANSIDINSI